MDELQHECGIAAIYHLGSSLPSRLAPLAGPEQVSRLMPRMLLDLQNRGQLAAGFSTYHPQREKLLDTYKQIGTVIEAFRLNHIAKYESLMREFAAGPPSAMFAMLRAEPRIGVSPSLSSAYTAVSGNGLAWHSTASWPISPNCAMNC